MIEAVADHTLYAWLAAFDYFRKLHDIKAWDISLLHKMLCDVEFCEKTFHLSLVGKHLNNFSFLSMVSTLLYLLL
jgi:hypothetical protein